MVDSVNNDGPLSVEDLLARSAAAAASKGSSKGKSKIQQMLAGREEDTIELSPVAKQLAAQAKANPKKESYTEQDWYLKAKVSQLKAQIAIYTNLPGLDPSGAIMDSLSKEVRELVGKQQEKIRASQAEAAAKKAELDKLNAQKAKDAEVISAKDLLDRSKRRANGEEVEDYAPKTDAQKAQDAAVQKLLDASAKKVNTTA